MGSLANLNSEGQPAPVIVDLINNIVIDRVVNEAMS
jgi:hypothetical protein